MRSIDYILFAAYLSGILGIGLFFARRKQTVAEFHVANRAMKWLPMGCSIVAAGIGAINFTQFSEEVFLNGLYVTMAIPVFGLVAWPVWKWIIPFFHETAPLTAYEYLERRFDLNVRRLASALFIIWRGFWMAVVLYATAAFLSAVTGIDKRVLIIITGSIATAYTFAGGMRAIILTDMVQFAVLFGSLTAGAIVSANMHGGFMEVIHTAARGGQLKPFHPFDPAILSFDPTIRMTVWSVSIGALTAYLSRYGVDQRIVQRYFTARSLQDARRAFMLNIVLSVLTLSFLAFIGLAIYAFTVATVPPGTKLASMQPLALFIKSLPFGICGLLVSGLCASTMASIDSGVHSCCTALTTDFLNPRRHDDAGAGERQHAWADRWLTAGLGAAATCIAMYMHNLGSIFEIANRVINGLGSPLLGLFFIGWFGTRSITARGVFLGGIAGIAFSIYTGFAVKPLALHYYAVVNLLATILFCYLFSAISRAPGSVTAQEP
ncbi:MAG: hypothetical protein C0404_08845 [Verrucomicrobia bacterium]|nr:hypothetical protein [Verrucomicrobiota bacterium]